ncbi:hypothetical protein ONZ43_g804 [Nemania bipapillata]|uniref:Uncharacterized protein n=1 Tax=Nemania bipapillata TaxID=110536 RepID=A0ACC2J703_9PEZI|nr:hypothetical protein ONZ43_g804 [Nemania bipapillata]
MSGIRLLKKIVKNEAMKTDPKEIYGWRVFLLACSACFGAASFGWDSGVIGGVIKLEPFIEDYKLGDTSTIASANLQANIVSVLQAGCFVGALAAYPLADFWGRKWCLIYASMFTLAGVILQAAASGHLEPLYIGRFVAGLGVGASSVVNPIYVAENAPRAIRGLLTGMYQLFIVTGSLIAFWTNFGAQLHLHGATTYIVPLSVQGLPALFLFSLMLICNESPRYLARKDRWEEAKDVLRRLRQLPDDHPYLQEEFREIADQLEQERRLMGDATFWSLQKEMWTVKPNRKRAILSITLMVFQQLTGTNAINVYAPTIFTNLGIRGTSNSLLGTGVYGIVKVVSCAIFLLFMADSLGRRRSLLAMFLRTFFWMLSRGMTLASRIPQHSEMGLVVVVEVTREAAVVVVDHQDQEPLNGAEDQCPKSPLLPDDEPPSFCTLPKAHAPMPTATTNSSMPILPIPWKSLYQTLKAGASIWKSTTSTNADAKPAAKLFTLGFSDGR